MAYPAKEFGDPGLLGMLIDKDDLEKYFVVDADLDNRARKNGRYSRLAPRAQKHDTQDDEAAQEENGAYPAASSKNGANGRSRTYDSLEGVSSVDTVGLYLREMSQVPLLDTEEEQDLAIRIERAKKATRSLSRLNGQASVPQKQELEFYVHDGGLARAHLIQANTRLVVSIAKKYIGRGVPLLDLIQEGNLGLMKAVEKYDHRRGFRFSTYATWWIRQTITRAIAEQGRTIRVPVHMIDRIRQLFKTAHEMEQELGRPPTTEELAEKLEVEPRKVQWMLRVSWLPLSLESPVGDDEESELGMFVEDMTSPTPTQVAYQNMLGEKIQEVLSTLSPREARILRLRFGLENGTTYTLEEVGKKFGLTRERIRQIEGKALRRLRHPCRSRLLKEYL